MEHSFLLRYTWGYETLRDRATTGAAAPTSHPVVESRQTHVGSDSCRKRLQELGLPVVGGVPKEGTHGASPQTDPGPSAKLIRESEATVDEASSGRPLGLRPSYGPVDPEADRPVDPQAVSDSVPPQPYLVVTSRHGVELPETGAPGSATGRSGDRPLEAVPLPALWTINRILKRHGLVIKARYQPRGIPYPRRVPTRPNGVHQLNLVGPCYLEGGRRFYGVHRIDAYSRAVGVCGSRSRKLLTVCHLRSALEPDSSSSWAFCGTGALGTLRFPHWQD
jgi:hypothetical protein